MHYVYILNSISNSAKFYVGYTIDLQARLNTHNLGDSVHTKEDRPWKLYWYCMFDDKAIALKFERYLKSHSGRAFAKKHFANTIA